jgi:hypothetical protein
MKLIGLAAAVALVATTAACSDWDNPLQPTTCPPPSTACATGIGNRSAQPKYETIYGNSPGIGR